MSKRDGKSPDTKLNYMSIETVVTDIVERSALGLVSVYNMQPKDSFDMQDISMFQGALQDLVKGYATRCDAQLQKLLFPRWDLTCHPLARR